MFRAFSRIAQICRGPALRPSRYTHSTAIRNADNESKPERQQLPTSIKKLNRLLSRQQLGEIPENELKESFIRGSGPGGQAINKTSSSVSLIHLPTGIRVQAQPTRSREANRKAARRILAEKLDLMAAGTKEPVTAEDTKKATEISLASSWSRTEIIWEKERRRKANRAKKTKRNASK